MVVRPLPLCRQTYMGLSRGGGTLVKAERYSGGGQIGATDSGGSPRILACS